MYDNLLGSDGAFVFVCACLRFFTNQLTEFPIKILYFSVVDEDKGMESAEDKEEVKIEGEGTEEAETEEDAEEAETEEAEQEGMGREVLVGCIRIVPSSDPEA